MKYCDFNGCSNKLRKGRYCEDHKSNKKKAKPKKSIYHNSNKQFYNSDVWKHMRSVIYQREKGRCQRCKKFVFGKQAQVHHVVPIKENPLLKLEPNNLKLLCPECHMFEENKTEKDKIFPSYFKK
ncbi:HNH endonuclease signature motif containing protein [Cytobacillus praedii]|uniref:HNH endonuclease n=1 Tax=Cytobacillus praedii TaxID=1742358 RepID=UPI002E205751|nr:HNH endonuclease signature motif containing protein [Cytobacillus praedii]